MEIAVNAIHKPPFDIGVNISNNFTIWKFNPIFLDVLVDLSTRMFGISLSLPWVIGITVVCVWPSKR